MIRTFLRTVLLACCAVPLALADPSAAGAWHSLLEDHAAPELRGWNAAGFPTGWTIKNGVLSKDVPVDDLVTIEPHGNFELELEWKIGKAGNSGVFYRGTREYNHIYWSAPEYQLLDNVNAEDNKSPLTLAGADYALYGADAAAAHPYGQWNRTRIVVKGEHIEHWLNGRKVVEYDLGGADWKAKVAASKFAQYPHYGLATTGLIGIQGDHPGTLAVRRFRIRDLP